MFSNRITIAFRRCNQMNAFGLSIITINTFQPRANSGNKLKIGGFIYKITVDFKTTTNNNTVVQMNFSFNVTFGRSKISFVLKSGGNQLFPQQRVIAVDM